MGPKVGVISVGGRGARLGGTDVQKCLIEISGKPILEYTVSAFVQNGISVIYLLTGFLNEQIDNYLGERATDDRVTMVSVLGGTDGQIPALLKLKSVLKEDFIYAGGDCIFSPKVVAALIRTSKGHLSSVAIMATNQLNETVVSHPRIELLERSDLVKTIHSPESGSEYPLVGMGMYYFRPEAFTFLSRVRGSSTSPTSDFVKYARRAYRTVAVSITNHPWFCLHTSQDLRVLQNLDISKFLADS